ncbi:HNH endonuclease [Halorubrum virus V_ICIS4]|nr:HNH endonuclease [Halorubrum virus V_ICIS4]
MSDENRYVVGPTPYDEETLRRLYVDERRTMTAIARKFDRDPSTIRRWMDEFGIERRQGGDAHAVQEAVTDE